MTNRTKGFALAAVSAASYGVNPLAVIMYNDGFSVDSVLFYRYALAAIFTAVLMVAQHESFRLTLKQFALLLALGFIFSFSSIALFTSYQYISVSIASTLLFCYPALVTIAMITFFGEKPNIITIISLVLVLLGVVLLNSMSSNSVGNTIGIAIVLLAALAYTIYIISIQKTSLCNMSAVKVSFYSILFGLILYVIRLHGCTLLQPIHTTPSVICAIALALFPTLISLTTMAKAIKYIGSTHTSILGALEPITATMIGIFAFGERLKITETMGMITLLSAVTLIVVAPKLYRRKNK